MDLTLELHSVLTTFLRHEGRTWYSAHRGRLWIAAGAKKPTEQEISVVEDSHRRIVGNGKRAKIINYNKLTLISN